jgi:hypothetical protein
MTEQLASVESEYREQAAEFVVHVMKTLDMGPESIKGPPGANDPTLRTAAFCYGVELAAKPLVQDYIEAESKELPSIFESTFRLSFHYSAGSPLIQSMYQARIARLLSAKYGKEQVADIADRAVFNPACAQPPANHISGRAMRGADRRAPAIWQFYMDILRSGDELGTLQPIDRMTGSAIDNLNTFGNSDMYPLGLPYYLLPREIGYARDGRPSKTSPETKYRSDVVEHSLKGKRIGNPEFNLIFAEMSIALHALRRVSMQDLPDFYLITDVKKGLTELEALTSN